MDIALCFKHPSNIIISGPTGCGKTYFVHKLLYYKLLDPMPTRLVLVYEEPQTMYAEWKKWFPQFEMIRGWKPDLEDKFHSGTNNLLILDDQMRIAGKDEQLTKLFTVVSHHRNVTIIYLVQNIFDKSEAMRTVSLNTRYFVLFKSGRDRVQLTRLGGQIFDNKPGVIPKALDQITKLTKRPYTIVCTDPALPDTLKLYTGIFPTEEIFFYTMVVYKGKTNNKNENDEECPAVNLIEI